MRVNNSINIQCKNKNINIYLLIKGDIFECEEDMNNPSLWLENCDMPSPELQKESRNLIKNIANYIVPGHGGMFELQK